MAAAADTSTNVPDGASLWSHRHYTDLKSWYSLPAGKSLELKPTKFADGRLKFLESVRDPPPQFAKVVSGDYDLRCWSKENCSLVIEGDKAVYLMFPGVQETVTYTAAERLPVLTKSWRPIVFMMNSTTIAVRVTENLALILTRAKSDVFKVQSVEYNKGFCCVHPCTDLALLYGSYRVTSTDNIRCIPPHECEKGNWGFFVHFFKWGYMIVPKSVEVRQPSMMGGICGGEKKSISLGFIMIPPNLTLTVALMLPAKTTRVLDYGTSFGVGCKQKSDYEIDVYLVLDGQLAVYSYSFDVRVNKPGSPATTNALKFKVGVIEGKWTLEGSKDVSVVIPRGGPTEDLGHLITRDLVAVFDAEIGQYITHPIGLELCSAFKKDLRHQETQTMQGERQ